MKRGKPSASVASIGARQRAAGAYLVAGAKNGGLDRRQRKAVRALRKDAVKVLRIRETWGW